METMLQLGAGPLVALAVIGLICTQLIRFWLKPWRSPLARIPGPPPHHFYFGATPRDTLARNLLTQWSAEQTDKYGRVWAAQQLARVPVLFLADPLAVQHCMLSASPHFVKNEMVMRILQTFFGTGLLGVDGEPHKRHRKVAFPAFTGRAVIDDMGPSILGVGDDLVERFERLHNEREKGLDNVTINAYNEFTLAAFDTIGIVGFNFRFNALKDEQTKLGAAFEDIFGQLVNRNTYTTMRAIFPFVGTIGHYIYEQQAKLDNARAVVDAQSRQLVDQAKTSIEKQSIDPRSIEGRDLLSLLVKSNLSPDTKPSERMSDEEVVSMVPTFLAAGHETTSSALAWAAYALTYKDGVDKQKRLRDELLDPENDGWQQDFKKTDALPFLDAVAKEVLRLYAPVRATRRTCTRDDVIPLSAPVKLRDGTTLTRIPIAKGDDVVILMHYMNTDKAIWGEDALEFRPERFLQSHHPLSDGHGLSQETLDSKLGWSNMATFTIGPRNCIGMRMAVAELKVLLAKTVANFHLLPTDETDLVEYRNVVVARPQVPGKTGFHMPCRIAPLTHGS